MRAQARSVLLIEGWINCTHHQFDQPNIWGQVHAFALVLLCFQLIVRGGINHSAHLRMLVKLSKECLSSLILANLSIQRLINSLSPTLCPKAAAKFWTSMYLGSKLNPALN